jgi:hypothetical protein
VEEDVTTVFVDVGIIAGTADTSGYWHIGDSTRGRIGTAKIGPSDLLYDYSARNMGFSVQRTSSRRVGPVVEYNAGTASLTLLNDDGLLDPAMLSSPPVGAEVRIRKVHAGVTYSVFRGYVTSWEPEHLHPDHAAVRVNGLDLLSGTSRLPLGAPVGDGETTGARINRILDSAGWPTAERDISTGDGTVQGTLLEGDALDEARQVTLAEVGELYVDGAGRLQFRNRRALLTEDRSNTSQATFGSDRAAGEIPYVGRPGVSYDKQQLINTVRATRVGGTEQVVSDAASVARYREHAHEESSLLLTTDTDARSWAAYVVRQDKTPELRFTSLTLDARVDPDVLYPQMLGREFGDRITVVRRPPGVVDSREVLICSIEHTWNPPDRWITTWALQDASKFAFWTIGHPTLGRIGRNAIAF